MYKIEIWRYRSIVEVYESEDIQDILTWYKWYWFDMYEVGACVFYVYHNGIELTFEEMWDLGFYK